jgi:hypothetical protein
MFLLEDWYDDVFHHSVGDDVSISADYADDGSVQVEVFSKTGARTSNVTLEIELANDASGQPAARVRAIPHSDRSAQAEFTEDVRGEIYVSSTDFARAHPLYIKFHLLAWWDASPVVLMGGIRLKS